MTVRRRVFVGMVAAAQGLPLIFASFFLTSLLFSSVTQEQPPTQAQSSQGAPTYKITPVMSTVTFNVKASVPLQGTFEKWDASLAFTSTETGITQSAKREYP